MLQFQIDTQFVFDREFTIWNWIFVPVQIKRITLDVLGEKGRCKSWAQSKIAGAPTLPPRNGLARDKSWNADARRLAHSFVLPPSLYFLAFTQAFFSPSEPSWLCYTLCVAPSAEARKTTSQLASMYACAIVAEKEGGTRRACHLLETQAHGVSIRQRSNTKLHVHK